mmetsp:Transcript_19245/g.32983  ORF Transcript_19245/g.32983 Transcript_19245/m.32983 type:complete len:84 (+) Transcript_19245:404-655(+)
MSRQEARYYGLGDQQEAQKIFAESLAQDVADELARWESGSDDDETSSSVSSSEWDDDDDDDDDSFSVGGSLSLDHFKGMEQQH